MFNHLLSFYVQKSLLLWGGITGSDNKNIPLAGSGAIANVNNAVTPNVGGGSNTAAGNVTSSSGGTQGLAHWMTVVAEHMNPETSSIHPTYMWNGIEVNNYSNDLCLDIY